MEGREKEGRTEIKEEGQGRKGTGERRFELAKERVCVRVCELVDENRYLYRVDEKE